ncbi:hypothetical protein [Pelosinus sp. sgz500959]|uniref:hypothetical protein n=1 Tax=Pelosinus sp. sgz500959 TaxID=3242472 RepID=UPI0036727107
MEPKYNATYYSKTGKSVVHVVAPALVTTEELEKQIREFHYAGWKAWNSLSLEECLRMNEES